MWLFMAGLILVLVGVVALFRRLRVAPQRRYGLLYAAVGLTLMAVGLASSPAQPAAPTQTVKQTPQGAITAALQKTLAGQTTDGHPKLVAVNVLPYAGADAQPGEVVVRVTMNAQPAFSAATGMRLTVDLIKQTVAPIKAAYGRIHEVSWRVQAELQSPTGQASRGTWFTVAMSGDMLAKVKPDNLTDGGFAALLQWRNGTVEARQLLTALAAS